MKMIRSLAMGALLSLFGVGAAHALVVTGQLEEYKSPSNSLISTVDLYSFNTSGGTVDFDVYEWGFGNTYIDSMVWLFSDDGTLDASDLIAENDDFGGVVDASVASMDSYLSQTLTPGDYLFAIGQYGGEGAADVIDGIQFGVPTDLVSASVYRSYDYQLTVLGPVTDFQPRDFRFPVVSIEEPGSFVLLGLGLVGLGFIRKRKD